MSQLINQSIFLIFAERLTESATFLKIQMIPVAAENERNIPDVYTVKKAT